MLLLHLPDINSYCKSCLTESRCQASMTVGTVLLLLPHSLPHADATRLMMCVMCACYRDRGLVAQWVQQAEAAGYKALVITVDAQRLVGTA